ncbi:MAG: response regulator transcription factor [Chloroflexi bacterium]|nr:response regulator transcription factor [Chloroflexota bacterium]MCI0576719.1 response regulator transcription factor [Chloroflexota bacterium]MCI0645531.1 response regulator transcription factor [Chloroflexota bacterium]MCI0728890.1 response regulator transcription factor [Chloroflexota bacterium]
MIRVLLVDDHAVVRDGLRALLELEEDISVVGTAADGREALTLVQQECPDVVVMDITMGGLNGIEATMQVSALCPHTNVVILSVHASSEYIFRALKAGARAYLLKESAGREVVEAVRTVYNGRRYLNEKVTNQLIDDYLRTGRMGPFRDPLAELSPREREVLQLVVEGKTSVEIAALLSLAPSTVETYRSRVMDKLGISDLPGLVKFAIQQGLTSLE